jgi:hypothetical protein
LNRRNFIAAAYTTLLATRLTKARGAPEPPEADGSLSALTLNYDKPATRWNAASEPWSSAASIASAFS